MLINVFLVAATFSDLIAYLVSYRRPSEAEWTRRRQVARWVVAGQGAVAFLAIVLLFMTSDWLTLGLLVVAGLWIQRGLRWMNERVGPHPDGSYYDIPPVDYFSDDRDR